jgi:uncharacterized protein (TIGR02996 family)
MTEIDSLFQMVIANPEDDLPRLVYADWIEENGQPERAAFIRSQIELSRCSPWEPFAVQCRHFHADDIYYGRSWFTDLPDTGEQSSIRWDSKRAYRRGFGWGLDVKFVPALVAVGQALFAAAPIGRLALSTATLQDWLALARCAWLNRVSTMHFTSLTTPIEPIRVLANSEHTTNLSKISFHRSDSPAMPEVLAGLMRSPLAQRLSALTFRFGCDPIEELIDALGSGDARLRLSLLQFADMKLTAGSLQRLLSIPGIGALKTLRLADNWLDQEGSAVLAGATNLTNLIDLDLTWCNIRPAAAAELASTQVLSNLRRLDLSRNPLGSDGVGFIANAFAFAGLRSLRLRQAGLDDLALSVLVQSRFWSSLVELDLRENRITNAGARILLDAPVPTELTALRLEGNLIDESTKIVLRDHYAAHTPSGWQCVT